MPTDKVRASTYRERNSTADRTLDVLTFFAAGRLSVTGAELAAELGVARSTAYRYLQTLTTSGFVEEDPKGGFRLGLRIFELARVARVSYGLSEVSIPYMRELASTTHEIVLLTRRSRDRVVCLEKIEQTAQAVRLSYERGSVLTLNAGASAWPLLAWESEETVRKILAEVSLEATTERSVVEIDEIIDRLAKIREAGYAVSYGELDNDVIGIGAPVFNDNGQVVACISMVGLAKRVEGRVEELVEHVREAAARASETFALVSQ